jgi:hypothetical protein
LYGSIAVIVKNLTIWLFSLIAVSAYLAIAVPVWLPAKPVEGAPKAGVDPKADWVAGAPKAEVEVPVVP